MKRIGFTASEEKSFENVGDGRIPLYTLSSPMSRTYEPSAQVR